MQIKVTMKDHFRSFSKQLKKHKELNAGTGELTTLGQL